MVKFKGEKYLWSVKDSDNKVVKEISSAHSISVPVSQVLYARGYRDKDSINSFLFTGLDDELYNPNRLKGASSAVERILAAIKNKEKILIFGDYDVDGITSSALLMVALLPLGASINYYLPNREKEGYGLSESVVEKASKNGYSLIITVDNGITAYNASKKAQELGVDLIITDHHRPHENLPIAHSIVDPNQDDCEYPFKSLAGVGVTFKIVSLIYKVLKKDMPDKIYELLMLGTVADVVPLVDENRFWVRHGLFKTNVRKSLAMTTLSNNGNIRKKSLSSLDIGFMIAPQINALGRLDDPRDAVKFLISSDSEVVESVGRTLKMMNDERKRVERKIYQDIEELIVNKSIDVDNDNVIIASSSSWPSGVIGLVAGKIMNNYGKPTFLFHEYKDGTLRGSCRSIPEFDVFSALKENQDLLKSFGGHSFAAGLSIDKKNIYELKERLEEKISLEVDKEFLQPRIDIDARCSISDMNKKLLNDLEQLEPFGNSNKQPTFIIDDISIIKPPIILKDQHVKCSVFSDGIIKPIIFFNRPDLIQFFNSIGEKRFSAACHIVKNEWQDRVQVEMVGLDVCSDRNI